MTVRNTESIEFKRIPIELIDVDPDQPRTDFAESLMREIATSVRDNDVVEPIQVVRRGDRYLLLNGARRLNACRMARRPDIPACIVPELSSEADRFLKQLLSNAHREDLNPIELCEAYSRLMRLLGINASELALKVSKSKTYVSNVLSLNGLPDDAKLLIRQGKIGLAKGALLARMQQDALKQAIDDVENGCMSRSDLERETAGRGGDRKGRPLKKVAFETSQGTVQITGHGKLTLADVINLLQSLTQSCKKAMKDGLDVSTLASILRDRKASDDKESVSC